MIVGNITPVIVEVSIGDTPTFQVAVTKDGVAFDLANCGVAFYCLRNPDDALVNALFSKDNGSVGGLTITSPSTLGLVVIALTVADKDNFTPLWSPAFRLVVTTPDGRTGAIVSGYFVITP